MTETIDPQPQVKTLLALSLIKGKAMEWAVQKAVELGVWEIQLLVTEHCVVKPDGKIDKWERVALEACKQCGRNRLPVIKPPVAIDAYLAQKRGGLAMIASLHSGARPLRKVIDERSNDLETLTILVGPEGDFSVVEMNLAVAEGFLPVTLGESVLRSETAVIYCCSAIHYAIT